MCASKRILPLYICYFFMESMFNSYLHSVTSSAITLKRDQKYGHLMIISKKTLIIRRKIVSQFILETTYIDHVFDHE